MQVRWRPSQVASQGAEGGRRQARLINDQRTHAEGSRKGMNKRNRWPQDDLSMGLGWGCRGGATDESRQSQAERKSYEPLKAAATLLRSCWRTDGGPPEDGGLDEG